MRKGTYINTYTNKAFYPLDPREDEVDINDIAHALSLMCRANGHYKHFYSVGQHSINCAVEAKARGCSNRIQLACLLHDASEAYISDLTRPVKKLLPEYLVIEKRLQDMIYKVYGIENLSSAEEQVIKDIDDAILNYEMIELLLGRGINDLTLDSLPDVTYTDMKVIRQKFINLFNQLDNKSHD